VPYLPRRGLQNAPCASSKRNRNRRPTFAGGVGSGDDAKDNQEGTSLADRGRGFLAEWWRIERQNYVIGQKNGTTEFMS